MVAKHCYDPRRNEFKELVINSTRPRSNLEQAFIKGTSYLCLPHLVHNLLFILEMKKEIVEVEARVKVQVKNRRREKILKSLTKMTSKIRK